MSTEFQQSVPDEIDEARDGLLNLLAEGKSYVFLTVDVNDDEDGTIHVAIKAMSDISDPEILKYVLQNTLDQVDNLDPDKALVVSQ